MNVVHDATALCRPPFIHSLVAHARPNHAIHAGPPDESFERIDRALHSMMKIAAGKKKAAEDGAAGAAGADDDVAAASSSAGGVGGGVSASPQSRARKGKRLSVSKPDDEWGELYVYFTSSL